MENQYPNFLSDEKIENHTPPPKQPRGVFFFIGVLLCLFLGIFITRTIIQMLPSENPTEYNLNTLEAKKPKGILSKIKEFVFKKDVELSGVKDDRVNVLILGESGPGHDGPYLTDTIIIASFKPSTNQVAMMSIPRDLNVNIPGYGLRKINNANAFAEMKEPGSGPIAAKDVIEKTFNTSIHYYIRVDFKAFEELVDKVGGVVIDVEQSFVDNEYPIAGKEDVYPISERYKILNFKKGIQKMDGATALEYARSRHGNNGEGSDYARSRRQQKVLLALKEKLLSFETIANPSKIYDIINTVQDNIVTNLTFSDMISFAKISQDIDTKKIANITLDDSPTGYLHSGYDSIGAFILTPKTGNFESINSDFANIFNPTSTPKIVTDTTPAQDDKSFEQAKTIIEVHNGTWQPGRAAILKKQLEDKKYIVGEIGNSVKRPQTKSTIYILKQNSSEEFVSSLQKELGFVVEKTAPQGENYSNNSDILVVIGEDFQH